MIRRMLFFLSLVTIVAVPALAQQHEHGAQPAERLGKVTFEVSCPAEVRADYNRGVALLHSFWYAAAIEQFNDVGKRAPSCAMVHWGVAMGIWGNPLGGTRTPGDKSPGYHREAPPGLHLIRRRGVACSPAEAP